MKNSIVTLAVSLTCLISQFTNAQSLTGKKNFLYSHKFSVLAGLIQPALLKGGNVEFNYTTKRMMFEYSHGFSLDPPSSGDYKNQQLSLHLPYSTGFGIGYRINSHLDVRFEPKLHSWEVYYNGQKQNDENKIDDYKTYTLGAGIYYRYFPFKNSSNKLLQAITTSSSMRWWQNVGSSLNNNEFSYTNKFLNKTENLKVANIGIGNTPLIFNVAIGYTLGGK
ncbi:hypothetical protein [Daejeonella sp.]|uniref:hypothetical protein n=1 Tax=Daejeonella sp. TaxID=2805397 RepID=UPI0030C46EA4